MTAKILHLPGPRRSSDWEDILDSAGRPIPHFKRYGPTGVIYFRQKFLKLGIPELFAATGETTIGRAKTAATIMVQKWKNKHLGIDDSAVFGRQKHVGYNVSNLIDEVIKDYTMTEEVRPTTRLKHLQFFELIRKQWGSRDPESITVPEFNKWIAELRTQKFAPKGSKRKPKVRKSFEDFSKHMNLLMRKAYEWGRAKHLMVYPNPDKALILKRKGRRYTDEEIAALWNELNEDMRDQFTLALECFMRLREALKLTWDRFNLKTGLVTLRPEDVKTGSKTGEGREFYLSPAAHERLKARWAKRKVDSPYVFPGKTDPTKPRTSNKTAWKLAKERAGITGKATWHHLRHTALSRALLENKANQVHVSQYAGVSPTTIHRVYLHSKAEETKSVSLASPLPVSTGVGKKKGERRVKGRGGKSGKL